MGGLVLLGLLVVGAIILGAIGFFIALGNSRKIRGLEEKLARATLNVAETGPLTDPAAASKAAFKAQAALKTPAKTKTSTKDIAEEKTPVVSDGPVSDSPAEPEKPEGFTPQPPPKPPTPAGPGAIARGIENFKANWVIWIGALSLALGGLFFVQYGLEQGILGPKARVACAIGLGIALMAAAEWLRRHEVERTSSWFTADTALAAGGIASLFAAAISAHMLYGLTSGVTAFVSMALVAWFALGAGILFGPVLAVIGLLGAFVTPFLVDSESASPLMYAYFALVLSASLAVERYQKWIWLSSIAVTASLVWAVLLFVSMPNEPWFAPYLGAVMGLTLLVPAFGFPPKWSETRMLGFKTLAKLSQHYPTILTVLTGGAIATLLMLMAVDTVFSYQTSALALLVFLAVSVLALHRCQNLDQLAPMFGSALIGSMIAFSHLTFRPSSSLLPHFGFTATLTALGIIVLLVGAIWRAERSVRPMFWIYLAAGAPVVGIGVLWLDWNEVVSLPARYWIMGTGVAIAVQIGHAVFFHRIRDRLPNASDAFATSAILLMLCMAAAYMTGWQLTVAIAALALLATATECRFDFGHTGRLAKALVALTTGRLVLVPGLPWALDAGSAELFQVFAFSVALLATGAWITLRAGRMVNQLVFETAAISLAGVFLCVLIARALDTKFEQNLMSMALYGAIWGLLAGAQLIRARIDDRFQKLRVLIGYVYGGAFALAVLASITVFNPLLTGTVKGPFLLDTLAFAYLLPAVLGYALMRLPQVSSIIPQIVRIVAPLALIALYVGLEIRRFWHGDDLSHHRVISEELYSYTVVMLLITVGLIGFAFVRRSAALRKLGLVFVGITAAKVFLWDMAGLAGLARATSFVALGLILAGIALVYQRYGSSGEPNPESGGEPEPESRD
ncbi:MAG: DUF2339 domain-containing protein [Rhodobacteraceae bacterium]|nr:DUF2339 domain-containing protein [Paracoccaceae bacterium]